MPVLQLKSISKSFGEEPARTRVLKNVSLEVEEGEFVAIVGFSGSGKTTLINLMAGLTVPNSGEVLFAVRPEPPQLTLRNCSKERAMHKRHAHVV